MGAPPCWCVRTRTCLFVCLVVCLFVCLCAVCVVCVRFSTVLHASFARLRDAVESRRSARPAVLGALSGPVPCRDPALPESVSTLHARTLTCCAAPLHYHPHYHARACAHARARHPGWLGSARPAVAAEAAVADAHASTTHRARGVDAFAVWGTHAAGTCRRRRASASAIARSARRRSA